MALFSLARIGIPPLTSASATSRSASSTRALVRQPPGDGNSGWPRSSGISGNLRSRFTDFLTTDGEAVARS